MATDNPNFAFFGTSEFAVKILDKLIVSGFTPSLVVTTPDRPQGRKMILTPPPVKNRIANYESSIKDKIKIIQPEKLTLELFETPHLDIECPSGHSMSKSKSFDLFIVAAYGKIIPKSILEIPKYGTLNVHPSLLPKFRGPSPIQSFILSESASGGEKTGVTIMLMDEEVDHGPVLAQQSASGNLTSRWLNSQRLEEELAELGGQTLVDVIPKWINGEIKPAEQDHSQATFTKKIIKEDGLVDLEKDSPEIIYKKFLAFQSWPGIYYFTNKNSRKIRVIITDTELTIDKKIKIKKVKPEGKKETDFAVFSREAK